MPGHVDQPPQATSTIDAIQSRPFRYFELLARTVASRHVKSSPDACCAVVDPVAGTGIVTASAARVRGSAGAPVPGGPPVVAAGAVRRLLTGGDGAAAPRALSAGTGPAARTDRCGGRGARGPPGPPRSPRRKPPPGRCRRAGHAGLRGPQRPVLGPEHQRVPRSGGLRGHRPVAGAPWVVANPSGGGGIRGGPGRLVLLSGLRSGARRRVHLSAVR